MKKIFMKEAIRLSLHMMNKGEGGPFGAVIVKDGTIIGKGHNCVTSINDPTAHAEIMAIRKACSYLNTFTLKGCEIYSSCEPCPMCLAALYWARIDTIYFGTTKEDAAVIGFDDSSIYKELSLSLPEKSIPMKQIMRNDALVAFDQWEGKKDRILY